MLKTLDLETLLDLIMFEDVETANARLESYGLYAVILPDTNTDIKKLDTNETMFTLARGDAGAIVDILVPELDLRDVAGEILTTAQETYDDEEHYPTAAEVYKVENYKSPFGGGFPTRDQEWGNPKATFGEKQLEERYRALLAGNVAGSKLPSLLQFYAHGITDSPIESRDEPAIVQEPFVTDTSTRYRSWTQPAGPGALYSMHEENVIVQQPFVEATSDERTVNNVMRHAYRVLSDDEKAKMQKIKDMGLEFWNLIDSIGSDRELSNAKTRIEEAVMWGVKSITK